MKNWIILLSLVAVASALLPQIRPTNCVANCKCKEILPNILDVIECDKALAINSTLFMQMDKSIINVVSFSNVIIEKIEEDAFKRFPMLEDVIIEKAQIGFVDTKAFNNVKKVKFSDCGFEDSPNLYSEKLEELHFGNCKLDSIPDLNNLFSLMFLNLSGNYIREVDIMSFAELFDLEELILSNNEISRIPANLFVNNEELNSLHLDNNPLKSFYLNTSNRLETLSLKNCYLSTFDERSTQRLGDLSELNLANNNILNLTAKDLAHMSQLTVIDLSNNSLRSLEDDIFSGNPKLQKVTLDGNKFEILPNFTLPKSEQFQIYMFSCKNCGLKTINKSTFKNMPAVVGLNLAYNNFTFVQTMFDYISSLRMLDISYNNINILAPGAFDSNRNLETLIVAGNPLLDLNPENFANTKAIKTIDATNCRLYKLWANNGTILNSLRKLLLANNQLTTLSIADFKLLPALQVIDLNKNPLRFDDKLCKVINYLERLSVYPIEYTDPKAKPEETLADDIDNFTTNQWSEFHKKQCPEMPNDIDDSEDREDEDLEDNKDDLSTLKKLSDENADDDMYDDNYDDNYDDDSEDSESEDDNDKITAEIVEDENINLARASYILSITSVFVLTALAVLIMAVTITLCILRRNNNFNMHRANLPRFKIPLWESQLSQKKHSGSVYRPLSEDLSGPRTPRVSRYEFTATPIVHSAPHS